MTVADCPFRRALQGCPAVAYGIYGCLALEREQAGLTRRRVVEVFQELWVLFKMKLKAQGAASNARALIQTQNRIW